MINTKHISAIRTLVLGSALIVSIAFPRAAAAQMVHSLSMGVPDLCAMPTVSAVANGLWSALLNCVGVHGALAYRTTVSSRPICEDSLGTS